MSKVKEIVCVVGIACIALLLWSFILPVSFFGFMLALIKLSFEIGYDYVNSGNFQEFLDKLASYVKQTTQNWRNK